MPWLAQLFPLAHILDAMRAITLDGAGSAEVATPVLVLAGMTAGFLVLGSAPFRWTPECVHIHKRYPDEH